MGAASCRCCDEIGTVATGRFVVFADGFAIEEVGDLHHRCCELDEGCRAKRDLLARRDGDVDKGVDAALKLGHVKPGRGRMARKAKAATSVRPKKPTVQPESVVTQVSAEQAATEIEPEAPIATAPDRERKSIRMRRLLDPELKAGEKWKRRLCRAAR